MSNIIQLLEKMSSDASLQNQQQFNNTIDQANINEELKQALINKDINQLTQQIKSYPELKCFAIAKPDDAPDEQPEPEKYQKKTY
jgi:hypothetical protein